MSFAGETRATMNNYLTLKTFNDGIKVFFILMLLIISACSHSKQNDYKDHLEKLSSLYEQAKYDEALVSCNEFISKYSESPFGYGMKGIILNVANRPKEALDSFNKQLSFLDRKDYRGRALALEQIGRTYFNLNDLESALDYFQKAQMEDNDLYSTIMLDIASVFTLKGDLVKAQNAYVKAKGKMDVSDQGLQQINKRNKGNISGKAAFIAFQLHKDSEALDYAVKYNEAKNNNQSKVILSSYFARMGLIGKAKELFNTVVLDNIDALELSEYYLNIGDIQHTIDEFDKSYEQQKTSEQVVTWKIKMQRKWPRDVWKAVRTQKWFSSKVY